MVLVELVFGIFLAGILLAAFQYAADDVMLNWSLNFTQNDTARENLNLMSNIWYILPIAVVFAFIYYTIAQSQKKGRDDIYYGQ